MYEQPSADVPGAGVGAAPEFRNVILTSLGSIVSPDHGDSALVDTSSVVTLVSAGFYERQAPFYVDAEQADTATRATVANHNTILKQQYSGIRMVGLPGATMTGQGAVFTRNGQLVKESVVEFTVQGRAPDGFMLSGVGGYTVPARVDRVVTAPCLLAKRPWYRNFGHWLVDGASVVALCADLIRSQNLTVVIGHFDSPKMQEVVRDTIAQLVPGATVLEHPDEEIWQFDNLQYVAPPHVPPLFKLPEALRRLRLGFLGVEERAGGRRIFITRRHAGNRRLVNEVEIYRLCAARGFDLVDTETMTIREQAALFAAADAVIGAKGAALTNVMFCRPGAKVMVLSPSDFPDPFFWDIAGQIGCDYGEVFGPVVTDKPRGLNEFMVEAPRVSAMLDAAGL
jgi:hypothetical protein